MGWLALLAAAWGSVRLLCWRGAGHFRGCRAGSRARTHGAGRSPARSPGWCGLLPRVAGSSPAGGGGGGLAGGVSMAESEVLRLWLPKVFVLEELPRRPSPELLDSSPRSWALSSSLPDGDLGVGRGTCSAPALGRPSLLGAGGGFKRWSPSPQAGCSTGQDFRGIGLKAGEGKLCSGPLL